MTLAYIAIGSNLADPVAQAQSAIEVLKQHPDLNVVAVSSLYSSTPMGLRTSLTTSMPSSLSRPS